MNALYILPLLLLSASVASAAEPAAAASTPVQAAPIQGAPVAEQAAAASAPAQAAPGKIASPQSMPAPSEPAPGASGPGLSGPAASTPAAAPGPAAQPTPPELKAIEKKAPERKARRHPRAKTPQPGREGETAPNKPGRHERIKHGKAPAAALDMTQGRNPVLEAINLVATTQRAEIQAADRKVSESDWWSDTLERDWIVKRPFGPGIFDSTHWFYVSYKVNGRILMSWFVDLNKGTVSDIAPPEKQSGH
jgi:hypothetical protein